MRYFEIQISPAEDTCPSIIYTCIRGKDKPTCQEALEFLRKHNDGRHIPSAADTVASVTEIPEDTALKDYSWPTHSETSRIFEHTTSEGFNTEILETTHQISMLEHELKKFTRNLKDLQNRRNKLDSPWTF